LVSLKFHTLIRNVNKGHKRLNEKYVSIMNENNVLREHVKENEQEIENLKEKVNEKQETYEEIVENLDSSEEKVKVLKLEKHKLQKRLCGLRINSNKRKSF
jgi:septal ring factor EnvC (AmiA/AmiB activator)